MIEELYDFLYGLGYDVFFIGQQTQDCVFKYVVIKDGTTSSQLGTNCVGGQNIDIILYAPKDQYLALQDYKKQIKQDLKLFKSLKYSGFETPTVSDDSVSGITCSITYILHKLML